MARRARTGQLNFGCPAEEKAAFEAEARRVGLSLSAWLRQAARAAAGLPSWAPPEVRLSAPPSPADLADPAPPLPLDTSPARARPGRSYRR